MKQLFIFSILIPQSIFTFGQKKSPPKIIDSVTLELRKANVELRVYKDEANRLEYLLIAKEMALRSTELKDSVLQILLAVQAHNFWKAQKGKYSDIDIYRGLYTALKDSDDPYVKTLPIKISALHNQEYEITTLIAEKLCSRVKRNILVNEWEKYASQVTYEQTCFPNRPILNKD